MQNRKTTLLFIAMLFVIASASFPAQTAYAAGEDSANWEAGFTLPGVNGFVYDLIWVGTDLYVAGIFSTVDGIPANNIARWDSLTGSWYSLGSGTDQSVNALAWDGTSLYAGGAFDLAGGVAVSQVARWDGAAWHAVGGGISDGVVYCLTWDSANQHLYVGGNFRNGGSLNRIARWDGTTWSSLGAGIDASFTGISDYHSLYSLAWDGNTLFAGGIFADADGVASPYLAQWDSLNGWGAVGAGVDSAVWKLLSTSQGLYVAGEFTQAGGAPASRIARWDGSAWHALGSGVVGTGALLENGAWALAWDNANQHLYVGGGLVQAGGSPANYVARWDGTTWSALGSGTNRFVNALTFQNDRLYVGGDFTAAGGSPASYVAVWDLTAWAPLASSGNGLSSLVFAVAGDSDALYAGGDFTTAGGVLANRVARWDGFAWSPLGNGANGRVLALALGAGTDVYVGGAFSSPGTNIARWNGAAWQSLGSGLNGTVRALAWDGATLYAAGDFTGNVACWNGASWTVLGSGANDRVNALALAGGQLFAAGDFTQIGGAPANRVALWDGASWSALGSGLNNRVLSLVWTGSLLFAGGEFTSPANYLAQWNGAAWSAVGVNPNGRVSALAWDGAALYAGGLFTNLGERLARWNGSAWSGLSGGLSGLVKPVLQVPPTLEVNTLLWESTPSRLGLWAGGAFGLAGGKISNGIAHWRKAAIWDGGGADSNASTPENWNGDTLPSSADTILFDGTSAKDALLNSAFTGSLAGIVVEDTYQGVITLTRSLALSDDLILQGGQMILPDPASETLTVNGSVIHSGGVFSQSRPVDQTTVAFLEISDGASAMKYRGVTLTSGDDLGQVEVSIRKVNPSQGVYCTTTGGSSPAYANRCYQITPAAPGAALVRLWALASELNGISSGLLSVYHYTAGNWVELLSDRAVGVAGDYAYAEGQTTGFSPFLLAQQSQAPTSIVLRSLSGDAVHAQGWWAAPVWLAAGILFWKSRLKRRKIQ